ncbi:HAMP domain-containing protein, partial [Paraclostridium tenue]|uniref:HAMP domain-containing protein n=1 Tax=Paraclostridium tenue TaxID=1737 RepID=UPI0031F79E00
MNNLKIGRKLTLAFGILLIISMCTSFYTVSKLKEAGDLSHELYRRPYSQTNETMEIRRDLVSAERNVGNAMLYTNPAKYKGIVTKDIEGAYENLKKVRSTFQGDMSLVDNLEKSISNFEQEALNVYTVIEQGNYKGAIEMASENTAYSKAYDKCIEDAIKLNEIADARGAEFNKGVEDTISSATFAAVTISIFNILAGVVICLYVTKKLKQPIEEIEEAANKMAEGDFNINIEYESKDELGSLSDSMRQMSSKTKEIINDAVHVLDEVASGNFD